MEVRELLIRLYPILKFKAHYLQKKDALKISILLKSQTYVGTSFHIRYLGA